jgi:PAS domain S-box-containing protein
VVNLIQENGNLHMDANASQINTPTEENAVSSDNLNDKTFRDEEFRKIRMAFLNILEDTEEARRGAVNEKNKTLAIINNLTDGLLVLDSSNKIELVSPLVELFLKQDADRLVGKNIFRVTSPDFDLEPLWKVLKDGKSAKIKYVLRKEIVLGGKVSLEVSCVPIEASKDKNETLIILHDVSRDKLVETMKTEFVSIAAHQLRTPLSAIKWTIRMLLDGDIGTITEEQKELLGKTYESNERMISLINDLLNVTRIEEGRFLYKPEVSQIQDVVESVIQNSSDLLKMRKINLVFEKPKSPLPLVEVDKEKIGLAIQNLLENAIKYTPPSGSIAIALESKGENVLFKIKDDGVGIPQNQQDRIFTKFFRGSNVIRMETDGTGLGLYTTKNIIEAHHGKIWFESEENKGTTFYFTVPVVKKSSPG